MACAVETVDPIQTEELPNGNAAEKAEEQEVEKWHAADWEWPCYDEYYNGQGDCMERRRRNYKDENQEEEKKDPFGVIYQKMKGLPWPERAVVEIDSEHLLTMLQKVWPDKHKLRLKATCPIKGRDLYLKLDQLKQCVDPEVVAAEHNGIPSDQNIEQVQLRHLIRFVETEFSETAAKHERMKRDGRASFDMLWTFMKPGENIVYKCQMSDEQVCGKVRKAVYKLTSSYPQKWCLQLKVDVYNYNCESFDKYTRLMEIRIYDNEKPLNKLAVYPYSFLECSAEVEARLLEQGARYAYLATKMNYRYMQYKGPMFRVKDYCRIVKENADGRVMVDQFNCSRFDNDTVVLASENHAETPSTVTRDGQVRTVDISEDPNRIYSPAIVYGFSFRLKKWGCFSVHGFSEVVFDGGSSWNQLVMDPDLKEMTEHLVAQHLRKPENEQRTEGIDPIANKGDGCVIVCYGPPGTGKTLTAESLAEKLHAPLWSVSVSELGVTPDQLEEKLVNILEVASSWKTVLLLDEADVYLEKRGTSDVTRSAMCGVFLRHLEYYRGVLVLTTNRIPTFDDAFRSRISVFLHYPSLTTEQREKIWTNFLSRGKLEQDESAIQKLVRDMAVHELNGREIRNAIQNGRTLAQALKEPFGRKHVVNATKILLRSLATLVDNQS